MRGWLWVAAAVLAWAEVVGVVVSARTPTVVECDVIIAGGSTAALATAVATMDSLTGRTGAPSVCFTEPTEWPGGQLTASGVPAVDFGPHNTMPANLPPSFVEMLSTVPGNPGQCWVSRKCYQPLHLLDRWIFPKLRNLSAQGLRFFPRTVVRAVGVEPIPAAATAAAASVRVVNVSAVQRTRRVEATASNDPWGELLSSQLDDWYSVEDSGMYTKQEVVFTGVNGRAPIVVDATEYGDVLALAQVPFTQGVEVPDETSLTTDSTCGQETVLPFYIRALSGDTALPVPYILPRTITPPVSFLNFTWTSVWQYRRVSVPGGAVPDTTRTAAVTPTTQPPTKLPVGQISNQDWGGGNDFPNGYLFLDAASTAKQAQSGSWRGGVNLTTLLGAELRAFAWCEAFSSRNKALELARDVSSTQTGLAMAPYIRDTRRSIGLNGFRLSYAAMVDALQSGARDGKSVKTGFHFNDTVAIGDYLYADTHRLAPSVCTYPAYMAHKTMRPYYIPYRALTNERAVNLLVAGKTMAQTFHANSATRLHPVEWSSGTAAGAAVALMLQLSATGMDVTTATLLEPHILPRLRAAAAAVGPTQWTFAA